MIYGNLARVAGKNQFRGNKGFFKINLREQGMSLLSKGSLAKNVKGEWNLLTGKKRGNKVKE